MPMSPHNTDSKTVRANVRCCAGAGVCVRVRFMGVGVGVGGWVGEKLTGVAGGVNCVAGFVICGAKGFMRFAGGVYGGAGGDNFRICGAAIVAGIVGGDFIKAANKIGGSVVHLNNGEKFNGWVGGGG